MKKALTKKLHLNRETLRLLDQDQLSNVAGGVINPTEVATQCDTCSCVTCRTCPPPLTD